MNQWVAIFTATLGVVCIYAGYQLFCGLPALNSPGRLATRTRVFFLNVLPGALLALAGTALLTTQAKAMMIPHRNGIQRSRPAPHGASWEGTSWHPHRLEAPGREA
jgi:hypothetical protein